MDIVVWQVGKGEEIFLTTVSSEVEERIGMEVSENGMQMFVVGSDVEGTKIRLGIGDDERMNEVNCKGTFNDWVSATVDESIGFWTEMAWIEAGVEVKV